MNRKSVIDFVDMPSEQNRSARIIFYYIVNMARNQNIACVIFICCFNVNPLMGKIFSRSLSDFRLFQQPHIFHNNDNTNLRTKRSSNLIDNSTTDHADVFHSQKNNLSTTSFSLHGELDNEAFVHWTGENSNTVFVLTRSHRNGAIQSSTLWRSVDYGESYSKINFPERFTVSYMYSSLADKSKIILSDLAQKQLYVTEDTGQSWKHVKLDFSPYRVLLHPARANLVLAYSLREMKLYVSEDFGTTWTLMMERVTERFFWAVNGVDPNPNTVHMELQDPMGPVTYFACIAPNCDKVEYDMTLGTIDFYSLVVENEYIFVQKSTDDLTSFHVSYKRGPFKRAYFPSNLTPLDFNIVDTSDHQVFIAVDHEEDIANLYLSDVTGQFYVMSVENVVGLRYPGKFDVDLVKVKGLNGIYIINKFETSREEGGVFSQRTYITFDKGGMWKLLNAPEDSKQKCLDPEKCNLHLHIGNTNQFFRIPMAVCTEEAPGLILAHGSVGDYLGIDTHVYISRDAGLTWKTAPFKGNHFLNIMDQGSAISAIAAHGLPTNQVHFSCTEGASWVTHNITSSEMSVDGVVNEPGIKTLISSVFGHMNLSDGWVMVKMDFASVLDRKCGHDDFELWQPAADLVENEVRCIMGENLVYERRKQLTECYYGEDYFRLKSVQTCACDREDFECDFGYDLGSDGTTCAKSDWFNEEKFLAPHCINGKYNQSIGYRKVAASKCTGGKESQYLPVETVCPLLAPRGLNIYSEKTCIQRGVNVSFRLTQESGSIDETVYTWSFGNGSSPVTIKGLEQAGIVTTSFSTIGTYNITVLAVNNKGKAKAVLPIHVEEGLKGVLVEIPWGARTGMPSYFNVTVLGSDNITKLGKEQSLHFAWHFENKMTGAIRQLTWQNVIQQEFHEAGEYILTLNVFNSVSSIFYTQSVEVYDHMTTVRLHFSEEINNYNSSSLNVRQALAEILCHNLAQILEIRRSRIIMSVPPTQPVVGDLTVLPPNKDINETETFQVVQMLIDQAKQQYLAFPLFTSDDIVIITDAGILDLRTGAESSTVPPPATVTVMVPVHVNVTMVQEKHSLVAVYISLPVLVAVIGLAVAIIIYYRKKLKSHKKYYPIVKHRSRIHHDSTCSCGEEDILGLEDPEDTIIPDSEYPDDQPTLMILNEPRSGRHDRSPDRIGLVNC